MYKNLKNIVLENTSLPTSIFDNSIGLNRKLIYETNLLGQQIKSIKNMPKLMIYDDGSVDKRVVMIELQMQYAMVLLLSVCNIFVKEKCFRNMI